MQLVAKMSNLLLATDQQQQIDINKLLLSATSRVQQIAGTNNDQLLLQEPPTCHRQHVADSVVYEYSLIVIT